MDRMQQLEQWLQHTLAQPYELSVASADASFRRYFRVSSVQGSMIVMDAPPDKEDSLPFVTIARLFHQAGVPVPEVIAQDLKQGFLLLTDLGDTTLLQVLQQQQEDTPKVIDAYLNAIDILLTLQSASQPNILPNYDAELLMREMRLFDTWYVAQHCQVKLSEQQQAVLDASYQTLLDNILAQPRGYVHRDYHSRNLMQTATGALAVLDFQDAVYGPLSYDLVSLLKDAYIRWDEPLVLDLAIRYWQLARQKGLALPSDFADFYRDFEWMGAQRHIKVLGIFARLYYRDGKQRYLQDIPLVLDYLCKVCERYVELAPMLKLLHALEGKQPSVGYTF